MRPVLDEVYMGQSCDNHFNGSFVDLQHSFDNLLDQSSQPPITNDDSQKTKSKSNNDLSDKELDANDVYQSDEDSLDDDVIVPYDLHVDGRKREAK